jgi:hypothetical protein
MFLRPPKKPPEKGNLVTGTGDETVSLFQSSSRSVSRTPPPSLTRTGSLVSESESYSYRSFLSDFMDDTMITVGANITIEGIPPLYDVISNTKTPVNDFQEVLPLNAKKHKTFLQQNPRHAIVYGNCVSHVIHNLSNQYGLTCMMMAVE